MDQNQNRLQSMIHNFKLNENGLCSECGEHKFSIQHHNYTEHITYTGPGCCFCGKSKEEHDYKLD